MKNTALLAIFFLSLMACTGNPEKDKANEKNNKQLTSMNDKRNAALLVDLVAAQQNELAHLQYALDHSQHAEIRDLAKRMMTDHQAFLQALDSLAVNRGIAIPSADTAGIRKMNDQWKDKSPMDLDRDWTSSLLKAHNAAIMKIEGAINDTTTDMDIKDLLNQTLPVIKHHREMLQALQAKNKW